MSALTDLEALLHSAISEVVDALDQSPELQAAIEQALSQHTPPMCMLTTDRYEIVVAIRRPPEPESLAR